MNVNLAGLILVFAGTASQGLAQWADPSSGIVFDAPTQSIRRIAGFPGAASLSKPLVQNLDWAVIAPSGKRGIAETQSGDFVWLEASGDEFSATRVVAPGAGPFLARWNAASNAVRIYSAACSCFFTVTLHSGQPVLTGQTQILDTASGTVQDFSWKQSITLVATDAGLYRMGISSSQLLKSADSGVTYLLEESGRVWATRGATGEILEVVQRRGEYGELRLVTADPAALSDVASIVTSGNSILAADRKTQRIRQIGLTSGVVEQSWDLDAVPGRMTSIGARPVWIVHERSKAQDPMLILDASNAPRVYFIPGGGEQ
ncbi:MAG: hypothetical protein ABI693_03400 [Bryobacteraceae bacterium]